MRPLFAKLAFACCALLGGCFDSRATDQALTASSSPLAPGNGTALTAAAAPGCRMMAALCTRDEDCCGGPTSGLPGSGEVYCNIPDGSTVGTCSAPAGSQTCNPEGDACNACGDSRRDCCGCVLFPKSRCCKPD